MEQQSLHVADFRVWRIPEVACGVDDAVHEPRNGAFLLSLSALRMSGICPEMDPRYPSNCKS